MIGMIYVTASTVTLGHFLDLLLFLQSVGRLQVSLLNVDQLVSQNLGNGLLGPESVLSHSLGDQVNGLVDSSEGRHVNCLLSHHTTSSNSGRILSGTGLDDSVDENLERVSSGEEMDDLKSMSDNSDGLNLLAGVSSVELERANKSFNDGAKCLSELLGLVSAGSVGDENLSFGGCGSNIVNEAGVSDLFGE
jgi:hypothetical protein